MTFIVRLYIQNMAGPRTGRVLPITCLGLDSFLGAMQVIALFPTLFVIGFEVLDGKSERQ